RPARGTLRRPRGAPRGRRDRSRGGGDVVTTIALRGILAPKLRTALAIVLGIAMVGGGYLLTDSISKPSTRSSRSHTRNGPRHQRPVAHGRLQRRPRDGLAAVARARDTAAGVEAAGGEIFDLNSTRTSRGRGGSSRRRATR